MLFQRKYRFVKTTDRFHLYEWTGAKPGSKSWLTNWYIHKDEITGDVPAELVVDVREPIKLAVAS